MTNQSRPLTPSRRRFMYGVATTAAATFAGPYILRAAEPGNEKLRIAYVGTGGQAGAHTPLVKPIETKEGETPKPSLTSGHICPAYCDVDRKAWKDIAKWQPSAKSYTDYRKMFDNHMKEIDAVCVAVPDHNHACASAIALREGKHVYTEKPLTWSVGEARALAELAAEKKVATQMGNMGHANEGNRIVVELVRGGVLGDIREVHTWTNRPVWPQGIEKRPASKPPPDTLDWESWIGPAPYRDYHDGLHNFSWRGWFDFGCGAVGDMGCHTWDCVFWAMQPDYPNYAKLVNIVGRTKETYPKQSIIKWQFPAKGNRPAFDAYWYEGGLKPEIPDEYLEDPARADPNSKTALKVQKFPDSGSLFIGAKGKLLVAGDYADSPRLIPESFMKQAGRPQKILERSPGHKQEWILAAMGEKPWNFPKSNFAEYAGPLTEVMLIGAMAIRVGEPGFKVECDAEKRTIKTKEVLEWCNRKYREGWPQVSPKSAIA
jgi:predicted dehydrogenase